MSSHVIEIPAKSFEDASIKLVEIYRDIATVVINEEIFLNISELRVVIKSFDEAVEYNKQR